MMRAFVLSLLVVASGCAHRPPSSFDPSDIAKLSCRQSGPAPVAPTAWVAPRDRASEWQLARWCATVGAVLFAPHPAVDPTGAIDQLAIVSWNVHEGHGDVDALIADLRAGRFTGGVPVQQFVLLLQEVARRDRSVPARVAPGDPIPHAIVAPERAGGRGAPRFVDAGFAVLYAPSMRNGASVAGGGEDRGNAIVSTLPLSGVRLIELPLERQRRVAIAATAQGRTRTGAEWRLDLVDVHLDTALAWLHRGPFAARRRQASALLAALDGFAADGSGRGATVVAGDLNTWMGDDEPAVRLLRDAFPGTPAAERAPTWRGPLGLHATLDHVFVRGAIAASPVVRLPGQFGSDHFPLLTIVRF
jgi:endonuclease/exonuclease/phosphatase family metal-dependent hydrolase